MYLLTTGNAASDLYFLDKNYNLSVIYKTYSLKRGAQNIYTWCPVTTAEPPGTGNAYEKGTAYVDSNPEAFYGEASAGCSILHKGSPSLNNFFYSYPTGSKVMPGVPADALDDGDEPQSRLHEKMVGSHGPARVEASTRERTFPTGRLVGDKR